MGVTDHFVRLYGPDLINTAKAVPHYYSRISEDADVEPSKAVVVDDAPEFVERAQAAGATAVLVSAETIAASGHVIGSLAELPAFLATITAR